MVIKTKLNGGVLPVRQHETDAGADLYSAESTPKTLKPLERATFGTGVSMAIPVGYMGEIRARSGLFFKKGIFCTGTIDSDYRGEIKVCLINLSNENVVIEPKERIAQLCIVPVELCGFEETSDLSETERGIGGFGSTGSH